MKRTLFLRNFRILALAFFCMMSGNVYAEKNIASNVLISSQWNDTCNIIIVSNIEPECILPLEKDWYYNEEPNILIACQGMRVDYTAIVDMGTHNPVSWVWEVAGESSFTDNGNGSITVVWGDGTTGQLMVTVYGPGGISCTKTVNVRLIEKPHINVVTTPAYTEVLGGPKVIYVCKGETVEFTELSSTTNTDIVGYYWESMMGGTSSTPNYKIENVWTNDKVTHRVYNNCGCYDEEIYEIQVLTGDILDLGCYGTVCEGSVVTYTAHNPTCSEYYWYVEGGTIVDGQNTPQVTVQWDNPQNGYGVIAIDGNLCGNTACPAMLSKKIPIIENNLSIKGQTTACEGEAVIYSIPLFGSTEYHWSITPNSGVTQVPVNGANEQMYIFNQVGTYQISVSYKCDFLECGEFTSEPITVVVKPKLSIFGEDRICITNLCNLSTSPTMSATWKVYDMDNNNQFVSSYSSLSNLSVSFPHPGKYLITAENNNYCRVAEFILNVQDAPPAPTLGDLDPNNPHTACLNDGVRLQAHPQNPNYTIVWHPTCNDASPDEISGNDVTINYTNTICNVYAYTYDRILNCTSLTPYVHLIEELTPATIDTSHFIDACPGTHVVWDSIFIPYQDGVLYEWTIQNNMQHCASVQGDHLSNTIDFTVNEQTSGIYGYTFYMLLKRTVCHVDYFDTFYVHVNDHTPTNLSLSADPMAACPDEQFTFTGSGGDPSTYRWRVDGSLVSFVGNPYVCTFSSPGPHDVTVLYNEMDECTNLYYYDSAAISVMVYQPPVINDISYNITNQTVCVDMVPGSYTYQWYYNMSILNGETNICTQYIGDGSYLCEVTDPVHGCTSSITKDIGPDTPVECDLINWNSVSYDFCSAELSLWSQLTPPDIIWNCSGGNGDRSITVDNNKRHATIKFKNVGTYYIQTSSFSTSPCKTSKYPKTIKFIPNFTFEKKCDHIVIHNNCRSLTGTETIHFDVVGHNSFNIPFSQKTKVYPVSSNGTYTFDMSVVVDGETHHCTYTVVFTTANNDSISIISANMFYPSLTCDNTPLELTVIPTPYFPISSTTWTFGDGSKITETGPKISHTFSSDHLLNPYTIVATVWNNNGCPIKDSITITSNDNSLYNGFLDTIGQIVCPNIARQIRYEQTPSCKYYWENSGIPSNSSQYSTYNTGLYNAIAVNNSYCHVQDNINVKFKNKPTAIIVTEKQKYCLGEKIMLYGATGPDSNDFSYQWNVTNLNNGNISQYYTATASFTPPAAGNYKVDLCITNNASGCSDCANSVTIAVYSAPAAPSIGFGSRLCMDDPPVELVGSSPVTSDLHWSNGNTGSTAYYFTPGVAISWYYDPTSGCKSEEAHITIEAQPDFDALLTGCYEKCKEFFYNNPFLPVWGLTTGIQEINWNWYLNGGNIANGYGNYTYYPLMLPLQGFGNYNLDVDYNNNNCHVQSPLLTIKDKEFCDCENLDISYRYEWFMEGCKLLYKIEVTVCNHSNIKDCVSRLEQLFDPHYIYVEDCDFTPTTLYPGDCYTFNMTVVASQLYPSSTIAFRIFDDCMPCTADFSINLMPEKIECEMDMHLDGIEIRPDLSSNVAAYFDFHMNVHPCQNVLLFWTEPPMIIDYWYDGADVVHGLGMVDYATLTQLMAEGREICFYAITCENDQLCKRRFCIPAEEVYNILHDMGLAKTNTSGGSKSGNIKRMPNPDLGNDIDPRLMPNPTTGEVNVIGTTDEVVEVLVMDMNGRQMATFENTSNFNISTLSSGIYIVRVKTKHDNTETITYLKLVKK